MSFLGRLVAVEAIRSDLGPSGPWGRITEVGFLPLVLEGLAVGGTWVAKQLGIVALVGAVGDLILPGDDAKEASGPMDAGDRALLHQAIVARVMSAESLPEAAWGRVVLAGNAARAIVDDPEATLFIGEMAVRELEVAIAQIRANPALAATVRPVANPRARPRPVWPWVVGGGLLLGAVLWRKYG